MEEILKLEYTEAIKVFIETDKNNKVIRLTFEETENVYAEFLEKPNLEELEDFLDLEKGNVYVENGTLIEQEPQTVTIELLQKEIEKRNETILETQLAMAELAEMVTQLL